MKELGLYNTSSHGLVWAALVPVNGEPFVRLTRVDGSSVFMGMEKMFALLREVLS